MFWDNSVINTSLNGANAFANLALDSGVPDDEKKGATVTRCLGELWINLVVSGNGDVVSGGIVLVGDDALAAGSLPDLEVSTDEYSWYWWFAQVPVFTSNPQDYSQVMRVRFDLRGQRKYPSEEHTFVLILVKGGVAININVDGYVRTLFKRA